MAKIDFNTIDKAEKEAIFNTIATEKGMTPFAVEKDWWVVQTLSILSETSLRDHLVFKGGTSLSKAWKLIERFSEDVDIAVGREFFGLSGEISTTQGKKLREKAGEYIDKTLFQELLKMFTKKGLIEAGVRLELEVGEANDRDRVIYVYYPKVIIGPEYMRPRVKIEIGSRSLMEPFTFKTFASLLDDFYPEAEFAQPPVLIPTVNPERTFLEKVFLLHEEFQRMKGKIRVERMSRHLYDIVKLANAGYMDKALENPDLYTTIVNHRQKFNKVGGVDYNLHAPQRINPIPPEVLIKDWRSDYNTMIEQMIYEKTPPSFDEILEVIVMIKTKINALTWDLNFNFPPPIQK